MKTLAHIFAATLLVSASFHALAQDKVYRCGNEYTNNTALAKTRNCKVVEGGNVTVVQTPRGTGGGGGSSASSNPGAGNAVRAPAGSPRVEGVDQRARDGEARSVLTAELRKAEARRTELAKDFNNGEPEKQGAESKNYQKYLDRVADMKAQIARNDADIAGLKREIDRLPASAN